MAGEQGWSDHVMTKGRSKTREKKNKQGDTALQMFNRKRRPWLTDPEL